jgi:hypothetical protein
MLVGRLEPSYWFNAGHVLLIVLGVCVAITAALKWAEVCCAFIANGAIGAAGYRNFLNA